MTSNLAIALGKVIEEDQLGHNVEQKRMVKSVGDPGPKTVFLEKHSFLTELVELGISIEKTGRDVLIANTHGERRQHGEKDVVERERPRFVNDLTRKRILEGVLQS